METILLYVFVVVLQAIGFGWFCSYIAGEKGRDTTNWFLLGFFFSFWALIAIAAVPSLVRTQSRPQNAPSLLAQPGDDKKVCPFCAETIQKRAVVCRYCQRDIPDDNSASMNEPVFKKTEQDVVLTQDALDALGISVHRDGRYALAGLSYLRQSDAVSAAKKHRKI